MIRSAVTISLVEEARGGPFVYWHDLPGACKAAAELGFDAVEIFPPGPEAVNVGQVRKLLGDHGLKLAAMGTGAGWVKHKLTLTAADESIRLKALDFVKSIIETAGALGAPAIIGSMQGRHDATVDKPAALAHLVEALGELGAFARGFGVPLFYEPLNRYETNLVNCVEAGVALLREGGIENVMLLSDLFHMNIEEADIAAALRAGAGYIGHLHFVDSNRRPAGCGHLDYGPIVSALHHIGFAGYASAEALPWPDSQKAAEQTMASHRRWFGQP